MAKKKNEAPPIFSAIGLMSFEDETEKKVQIPGENLHKYFIILAVIGFIFLKIIS